MIRRARHSKATGKASIETAYGVTSHTPDTANAQNILTLNRGHWCIENTAHHCLDWSWDEDRSRIRTGNGPENTTRLRRFAIGLIKARGLEVARPCENSTDVRCVFDFLKMTANTQPLPNRDPQRPAAFDRQGAKPKARLPTAAATPRYACTDRQTIARPPPWPGHAPIRKYPHR